MRLTEPVDPLGDLTRFALVSLRQDTSGRLCAAPVRSTGSGDAASLLLADGLAVLPGGARDPYDIQTPYDYLPLGRLF